MSFLKCSACLTVNQVSSIIAYCPNCQEEYTHIPNIRNFTPHPLNLQMYGSIYQYPSEGIVSVNYTYIPSVFNGLIPAQIPQPGEVKNLPDEQADTFIFVSAMVRSALPERKDLISPSTKRENIIRDEKGNIIAITGFDSNY